MHKYLTKIVDKFELEEIFNKKISVSDEPETVRAQKERRLIDAENETKLYFFGFLDGEPICEGNATISVHDIHTQNIDRIMDEKTAYLSAFFTREDMRGMGYFSKLYNFMENHLKLMGFEYLTLGVEPGDLHNKAIYKKWGYAELIYCGAEAFDGITVDVEYYRKKLHLFCDYEITKSKQMH